MHAGEHGLPAQLLEHGDLDQCKVQTEITKAWAAMPRAAPAATWAVRETRIGSAQPPVWRLS
jgi:hypothetical protein